MKRCFMLCFYVLAFGILPASLIGQDEPAPRELQTTAEVLRQPSMNVFRRFSVDAAAMYDFYGKLIGLKQLNTFNLGGNSSVARFQAGASEFKLSGKVPNRQYQPGGVQDATGLRLLTLFIPEHASLVKRFQDRGLPIPEFRPIPGSDRSSALVKDPDGQWIELVSAPNAPASIFDQIEIGLTVSNMDISRKFYREFVGLEELPAIDDPIFKTKKYSFRYGSTIISLRSFGKPLPADTGSGGIQYVVSDIKAVEALAKARKVTIAQPLSTLAGFALKTIWFDDPDGITNYFAETAVSGKPPAKQK